MSSKKKQHLNYDSDDEEQNDKKVNKSIKDINITHDEESDEDYPTQPAKGGNNFTTAEYATIVNRMQDIITQLRAENASLKAKNKTVEKDSQNCAAEAIEAIKIAKLAAAEVADAMLKILEYQKRNNIPDSIISGATTTATNNAAPVVSSNNAAPPSLFSSLSRGFFGGDKEEKVENKEVESISGSTKPEEIAKTHLRSPTESTFQSPVASSVPVQQRQQATYDLDNDENALESARPKDQVVIAPSVKKNDNEEFNLDEERRQLPELKGWVMKKANSKLIGWQKRYLYVHDFNLYYSKTEINNTGTILESELGINTIPLLNVTAVDSHVLNNADALLKFSLQLADENGTQVYKFKASSEVERNMWESGLKAHWTLLQKLQKLHLV